MDRIRHFLLVRHKQNWLLFFRFGLVGGSGVLVNMLVVIGCNKLGPNPHGVAIDLPLTDFNVRWYHVYSTVAFLVANLWNFQLNRWWTFKSAKHAGWLKEYLPFLAVGLIGLVVNLVVVTLLLKDGSPLALPATFFDDSSGFRNRYYWAQLIAICVVVPLSFVLNKIWTFAAVRGLDQAVAAEFADTDAASAGPVSARPGSAGPDTESADAESGEAESADETPRDTPAGAA